MALNKVSNGGGVVAYQTGKARGASVDAAHEQALLEGAEDLAVRFRFWRGVSGKRYVHTAYPLLACPELPAANYVLVRRNADGSRTALRVGRTTSQCGSLNRADLRQRAARLGANEVHVHLITESERDRKVIEMDLQASLFASLTPEPLGATVH
jgi:hypothetical protein